MTTHEELDKLSTKELHDRAFRIAERRLEVRFFWNLLEYAPVAEAIAGHTRHAEVDVLSLSATVQDPTNSGENEVGDALRPIYIDYLLKHDTDEKSAPGGSVQLQGSEHDPVQDGHDRGQRQREGAGGPVDLLAQLVSPGVHLMPEDFDLVVKPLLRVPQVVLRGQLTHAARR